MFNKILKMLTKNKKKKNDEQVFSFQYEDDVPISADLNENKEKIRYLLSDSMDVLIRPL